MPKIIINADDFGKDAVTNKRIIDCFERGLISSATVMANMPGLEEVVEWYAAQSVKPGLGIHLNLDEGQPVSQAFKEAYPNSRLYYPGGIVRCDKRYLQVIAHELRAQVNKLLSHGIAIDHIDSHHHLHERWPIARVVVALAEEFRINNIRMAGNLLFPTSPRKWLYRYALNRFLFQKRLQGRVRLFTYLDRFVDVRPDIGSEIVELMIHPGVEEEYALLTSERYAEFIKAYELDTYSGHYVKRVKNS